MVPRMKMSSWIGRQQASWDVIKYMLGIIIVAACGSFGCACFALNSFEVIMCAKIGDWISSCKWFSRFSISRKHMCDMTVLLGMLEVC